MGFWDFVALCVVCLTAVQLGGYVMIAVVGRAAIREEGRKEGRDE